jgi:hypothetical protein
MDIDVVDIDTQPALQVIVLVGQPPSFLLSAPCRAFPLPSPDPSLAVQDVKTGPMICLSVLLDECRSALLFLGHVCISLTDLGEPAQSLQARAHEIHSLLSHYF